MRYGIISDIHSNLEALKMVLHELEPLDEIICLGDIVGYGPKRNECIEMIKGSCKVVVAGNHDLASIEKGDYSYFSNNAKTAIKWTMDRLSEDSKKYILSLPYIRDFGDWVAVHGGLEDYTNSYVRTIEDAKRCFELLDVGTCLVGHTHIPLCFIEKREKIYVHRFNDSDTDKFERDVKAIINVGSVGQPRDGDNRASFGIFIPEDREVIIKRVKYDILKTQELMKKEGLPTGLINRLATG